MTLPRHPCYFFGSFHLKGVLLLCCILIVSCSSRKEPAPVSELYQGKTYKDFKPQGYVGTTYKVQAGDTLFSIAWYTGNDYRDLAKANNISVPYHIYPGQLISLGKAQKSTLRKSNKATGLTSKTITNQVVDPSKKQAYGESEKSVNSNLTPISRGKFSDRVKLWTWPTNRPISQGYSAKDEGNSGIDFWGKRGEPIWASADGKVVYTGDALRGFGKLIIIKHSEAYLSAYAHNDTILVQEQQWVKAGDKIATMGTSGTDKVKLHFEVRYKGKSVNPLRYLPNR